MPSHLSDSPRNTRIKQVCPLRASSPQAAARIEKKGEPLYEDYRLLCPVEGIMVRGQRRGLLKHSPWLSGSKGGADGDRNVLAEFKMKGQEKLGEGR